MTETKKEIREKRESLGLTLRKVYKETLDEPIPDHMMKLLDQLADTPQQPHREDKKK